MDLLHSFEKDAIVFHYNKKHNEDPRIPTWILKVKGETFYVNHVTIQPHVGFSTKETPDNPHTKGALKMKGSLNIYVDANGKTEGIIS